MTETTGTAADSTHDTQTAQAATDDVDQAPDAGSGGDSAENAAAESNPNSEAARYRTRLRETEAQRDALKERLDGYLRREAEAAVADLLDVPGDLFEIGGVDVGGFYDDAGKLNSTELRAAAGALLEQRPRLAKQKDTEPRRAWGQTSGPAPQLKDE